MTSAGEESPGKTKRENRGPRARFAGLRGAVFALMAAGVSSLPASVVLDFTPGGNASGLSGNSDTINGLFDPDSGVNFDLTVTISNQPLLGNSVANFDYNTSGLGVNTDGTNFIAAVILFLLGEDGNLDLGESVTFVSTAPVFIDSVSTTAPLTLTSGGSAYTPGTDGAVMEFTFTAADGEEGRITGITLSAIPEVSGASILGAAGTVLLIWRRNRRPVFRRCVRSTA